MIRTCWVDLLVDEQLKKVLGDVKPEPDGFSFPWEVFEVDLIYDAPISVPNAFSQKILPVHYQLTVSCKTRIQ